MEFDAYDLSLVSFIFYFFFSFFFFIYLFFFIFCFFEIGRRRKGWEGSQSPVPRVKTQWVRRDKDQDVDGGRAPDLMKAWKDGPDGNSDQLINHVLRVTDRSQSIKRKQSMLKMYDGC